MNALCNITCANFGCDSALFHCPETSLCNAQCISGAACRGAVFDGNGVLSCSGDGQDQVCFDTVFPVPPALEARTFICDYHSGCAYAIIHCPSDANCTVVCNGTYSCADTMIYWPTNTGTVSTLSCNGFEACANTNTINIQKSYTDCTNTEASCKATTIVASSDSQRLCIDCSADRMCEYSTIICPMDADCIVLCNARQSCTNAVIYGPNSHKLDVVCGLNRLSCFKTWIYAQTASFFTLAGCVSTLSNCYDMRIWFPPHDTGGVSRTIINQTSEYGFQSVDLYTTHGWSDIYFVNKEIQLSGSILHCSDSSCA
eukprot:972925_1